MTETRYLNAAPAVVKADVEEQQQESRTVRGYGAVFDSPSEDLGFREVLAKDAITEETIRNSDVLARFNHDDSKVLARCNHGEGSLRLSVDERGLAYEFEAPKTAAGEELLEALRRGDISQSSFAFTVNEKDETWAYRDGILTRTIHRIDRLFDVAPVYTPAYSATSCANERALERAKVHLERESILKGKLIALQEKVSESDAESLAMCDELRKIYDTCVSECRDLNADELKFELRCTTVIENKVTFEAQQQKEAEERTKLKNDNVKTKSKMTKKVSLNLLPAILAVLENRSLEGEQKAVNDWGRELAVRSGKQAFGQIFIPTEKRAIDIATEGADVVGLEIQDIIEATYGKGVLAQAGARFMTGLSNDIQFPILNGSTAGWAGENGSQVAGTTFGSAKLSPKRLTTYVDVSMQFLKQASASAEAILTQDLVNAIYAKLESTILGSASGVSESTAVAPEGLFYLASGSLPTVSTFANITALESRVEDASVAGECKYIASNKAKAILRNAGKSTKTTSLIMEAGEIDGTAVLSTSNVAGNGIAYGDWSRLVVGQWGALDITVDNISQAYVGNVRLVVNSYWDAKVLGAINKATTGTGVIAVANVAAV